MAKILLVEDDSNLREIYGARLDAEGYQIISASDGEEALATAVREKPDLIISDVMMPKISGFDMLDILRSTPETKDVKVIVMTALSQDEDRKRGESLGADRYVVKSQVTLDDIVTMVRDVLGEAGIATPQEASQPTAAPTPPSQDQNDPSPTSTNANPSNAASDNTPPNQAPQAPAAPVASNPDSSQTEAITPADAAALTKEVEQFVATSPLMNGTPPQTQPTPSQDSTITQNDDQQSNPQNPNPTPQF